jgi:hypothetical protein
MNTQPLSLTSLDKADEIIAANPTVTTLRYLVALAYLEGRIEMAQEIKPKKLSGIHEFDCICQRCGRRDGSRHVIGADAPKLGYFETVCFHCSAGDEPRAA